MGHQWWCTVLAGLLLVVLVSQPVKGQSCTAHTVFHLHRWVQRPHAQTHEEEQLCRLQHAAVSYSPVHQHAAV